jgi:hypothetical protein
MNGRQWMNKVVAIGIWQRWERKCSCEYIHTRMDVHRTRGKGNTVGEEEKGWDSRRWTWRIKKQLTLIMTSNQTFGKKGLINKSPNQQQNREELKWWMLILARWWLTLKFKNLQTVMNNRQNINNYAFFLPCLSCFFVGWISFFFDR